jgi:hypothetical protein
MILKDATPEFAVVASKDRHSLRLYATSSNPPLDCRNSRLKLSFGLLQFSYRCKDCAEIVMARRKLIT